MHRGDDSGGGRRDRAVGPGLERDRISTKGEAGTEQLGERLLPGFRVSKAKQDIGSFPNEVLVQLYPLRYPAKRAAGAEALVDIQATWVCILVRTRGEGEGRGRAGG